MIMNMKISIQRECSRVLTVAMALAVFWGALSLHQSRIWRNSVTLFEYMIRELGDDPNRSDIQWRLGFALAGEGKMWEAVQQYQASLRIRPTPNCSLLLAELLAQGGDRQGALTNCLAALALGPSPVDRAKARLDRQRLRSSRHCIAVAEPAGGSSGKLPSGARAQARFRRRLQQPRQCP